MKEEIILLVDDNAFALKELVNILKYIGYKNLTSSETVDDAFSTLKKGSANCIIAALEMENVSGMDLLKKVRAEDDFMTLPFFLTDSAFTKEKIIRAGLSGVTGLLVTPYDKENLNAKMEMVSEKAAEPVFVKETKQLNKGMDLLEKGNYKEAIDMLDEVINSEETAEYYYNIGYIKTLEEKYSEAIPAFQKATQLDSLFGKAFEGLGRAYSAIGEAGEAEKYMQKAADIYLDKNKIEDAESILNDILEISTDSVNIYNSLGVLYRRKGDFKEALKQYKKALKIHTEEVYILYNVGRLYIDMNEPENAIEYFEKALIVDPDFKEAREVLDAITLGSI